MLFTNKSDNFKLLKIHKTIHEMALKFNYSFSYTGQMEVKWTIKYVEISL